MYYDSLFTRFAKWTSHAAGHPATFGVAVLIILVWALTGPIFGFSDTWQLVINTGTTIITFLMVFLIQNTQNRDAKAIHLKLDELIKATKGASNTMIDLDKLSDEQLKKLESEYKRICDIDEREEEDAAHPINNIMEAAREGAKEAVEETVE